MILSKSSATSMSFWRNNMDEQKMAFELADTLALTEPCGVVNKAFIVANHIKRIEAENKKQQDEIKRLLEETASQKGISYECKTTT